MIEEARYVNHLGESVELSGGGVFVDSGELANWSIGYSTMNGRIVGFAKDIGEMPLSLAVIAKTEAEGAILRNALYEIARKDVAASVPGHLYVGGWYMRGYVTASAKSMFQYTHKAAKYELSFVAEDPRWTLEHVFEFPYGMSTQDSLNFPFNFPFNFGSGGGLVTIDNPDILPSAATITVSGPADCPRISIGGSVYEVEAQVPDGGVLVIDGASSPPTIELVAADGTRSNAFGLRRGVQKKGSGSYVFEPIKPGVSTVSWDGEFGFELRVFERRDERRWIACT